MSKDKSRINNLELVIKVQILLALPEKYKFSLNNVSDMRSIVFFEH